MKKHLKYQGPALWWALFILLMCSISLGSVGKSHLFFEGFDKVTHCGLFFVLVTLMGRAMIRRFGGEGFTPLRALGILLLALLYGGLIEILQIYLFTWRSGEWADLFCDAIGSCMAIFCILVTLYPTKNAKA